MPSSAPPRPGTGRLLAVVLLVPVIVALALAAFAWPAARLAPRDVPVGVAGPAAATAPLAQRLESGGAFEVTRYPDGAAARAGIADREVYGAYVPGRDATTVLTSSAASPAVARLLGEAAQRQAPPGTQVRVVDVVPAPEADPNGAALGASTLPLALAGVAAGALATLLGLRGARAVAALAGAAALVGVVTAALAHSWLGVLTGNWWAEAGAVALTTLAVGTLVAGLGALLGPPGIAIGALLTIFLGNPWSGVTSAPELLPEPAGTIGQLLPSGAGGSLLRSTAFFDGAGAAGPVVVLCCWTAAGLAAVALGGLRARRAAEPPQASQQA